MRDEEESLSMAPFGLITFLYIIGYSTAKIASRQIDENYRPPIASHRYPRNESTYPQPGYNPHAERIYINNGQPVYRYDLSVPHRRVHHGVLRRGHNLQPGESYSTGIYRSYGMGRVTVPKVGATIAVLNTKPSPKVNKGIITARLVNPSPNVNEASARLFARSKRCMTCPPNRKVVASKGNPQVILPEPCQRLRWVPLSGPKPGMKIAEGIHSVVGRIGSRGKICRYEYEVVVRHCGEFIVEAGNVNCTADDVWGSKCNVTCDRGYTLIGSSVMTCEDDLKWSSAPPVCKKKTGCTLPQTPDDTKIWCQIPDGASVEEEVLPAETHCRFRTEDKLHVITCIDGYWVIKHTRRRRKGYIRRRKHRDGISFWRMNAIDGECC